MNGRDIVFSSSFILHPSSFLRGGATRQRIGGRRTSDKPSKTIPKRPAPGLPGGGGAPSRLTASANHSIQRLIPNRSPKRRGGSRREVASLSPPLLAAGVVRYPTVNRSG